MTRDRIAEGLLLIVDGLAHPAQLMDPPNGWDELEWAYIKGLASGELMRLRDRIVAAGEHVK